MTPAVRIPERIQPQPAGLPKGGASHLFEISTTDLLAALKKARRLADPLNRQQGYETRPLTATPQQTEVAGNSPSIIRKTIDLHPDPLRNAVSYQASIELPGANSLPRVLSRAAGLAKGNPKLRAFLKAAAAEQGALV